MAAVLDNGGQVLPPIQYLLAAGPTTITFNPFADNIANPTTCGPRTYTIAEAYPWASIIPPAAGLEHTDPWTLSVSTTDIAHVGTYTLTINAVLTNYPTATPA